MSRKLTRLLFVASVLTGVSAPMLGAYAATQQQTRGVDAWNLPRGFEVPGAKATYQALEINKGDWVTWSIMEGEHTVTPKDKGQWGDGGSGDTNLTPSSERYTAKGFKAVGDYVYFCKVHGGIDENDTPFGMWGVIHVVDPAGPTTTTTTPPTTAPPATTPPTQPGSTVTTRPSTPPATTATAPASSAGRPAPTTAPKPTTTTAKADKDKHQKDETTTTTAPPPPPIDLPDSAIIPALPGSSGTSSTEQGPPAEAPNSTPEGEAVALLKAKKNNGNAVKLLILSGVGLGALGIGTAGYKYANRSSKYFPA